MLDTHACSMKVEKKVDDIAIEGFLANTKKLLFCLPHYLLLLI